jgi:hypothetical protein
MNRVRGWAIALALGILGLGCRQEQGAAPGTGSGASLDSVRIVSISPDTGATLRVGDRVTFKVEVEYNLTSTPSGTITLVIQQGESGRVPLANETQVVQKGSGKLVLTKDIEVPETNAVQVFTPLSAQGGSSTRTVDTRAFKVVKR